MSEFSEEEMLSAARYLINKGKADKEKLARTPEWVIIIWAKKTGWQGWKGDDKNGRN